MLEYKVYVIRKIAGRVEGETFTTAQGTYINGLLSSSSVLGVLILNNEFHLTVDRVKRLERLLGSVFGEKVSVIY